MKLRVCPDRLKANTVGSLRRLSEESRLKYYATGWEDCQAKMDVKRHTQKSRAREARRTDKESEGVLAGDQSGSLISAAFLTGGFMNS